jgi:hypothetical protein
MTGKFKLKGLAVTINFRFTRAWFQAAEKDFIELALGEAFATLTKVSEAARRDGGKEYRFPEQQVLTTVTVSRGGLRSNTLKFTIGSE